MSLINIDNVTEVLDIDTRLPAIKNGLKHFIPFEGRSGCFDIISGYYPNENNLQNINLIELCELDWRDPKSWEFAKKDTNNVVWDDDEQALRIEGMSSHIYGIDLTFKNKIKIDPNKKWFIEAKVKTNYGQSKGLAFYLGCKSYNTMSSILPGKPGTYDYFGAYSVNPPTEYFTYKNSTIGGKPRTGTDNTNNTSTWYTGIEYMRPMFTCNYGSGTSPDGITWVKDLKFYYIDEDDSNCIYNEDSINIINNSKLFLSPNIKFPQKSTTISLEAKADKNITEAVIFDNADINNGNKLYLNSINDKVYLQTNNQIIVSAGVDDVTKFHHYTCVLKENSHIDLYVDGKFKVSTNNIIWPNRTKFALGSWTDNTHQTNVSIRNFSIYERMLSSDEINQLANSMCTITNDSKIIAKNINTELEIPKDAYYFPLANNDYDITGKYRSIEDPNSMIFYDNKAWCLGIRRNEWKNGDFKNGLDELLFHNANPNNNIFKKSICTDKRYCYNNDKCLKLENDINSPNTSCVFTASIPSSYGGYAIVRAILYTENDIKKIDIGINNSKIIYTKKNKIANSNFWELILHVNCTANSPNHNAHIWIQPGVTVYISHMQLELSEIITPPNIGTFSSKLRFNLNKELGLKWNEDWTIMYRKTPIGTHSNNFNGYNLESLGCNGNSVGKSYIAIGKDINVDSILVSGARSYPIDKDLYFNKEEWVVIKYDKITKKNTVFNYHNGKEFKTEFVKDLSVENAYLTQYGYDLYLGGHDNGFQCNTGYRDLIVVKRCLSDDEIRKITKEKVNIKKDTISFSELYVRDTNDNIPNKTKAVNNFRIDLGGGTV